MTKLLFIRSFTLALILGVLVFGTLGATITNADSDTNLVKASEKGYKRFCGLDKSSFTVVKTVKMLATAYSSSVDETDDTPFITASGDHVADGIIANNMLPFGTKVRIPQFGDKIFIVQDRMNARKGNFHLDIWKTSKQEAINFGSKMIDVQILED